MPLPNFLKHRYREWKNNIFPDKKKLLDRLEKNGQKPRAMIISCSDSRVNPNSIFQADFGDFFIYRNIANLIPSYKSKSKRDGIFAAIEYAVKILKIQHVIILGHSCCGGVKHAHDIFSGLTKKNDSFIDKWVENIKSTYNKLDKNQSKERQIKALEKLNIVNSISNLLNFSAINNLVSKKELSIHGVWLEIKSGEILYYNQKNEEFEKLY